MTQESFNNYNYSMDQILFNTCKLGHVGILKETLKIPGVNINTYNGSGMTPLMCACEAGQLEIVKELLKIPGIDINTKNNNIKNNWGQTALMCACIDRRLEIVKELLKMPGIDINAVTNSGSRALGIACIWDNIINIDIINALIEMPHIDFWPYISNKHIRTRIINILLMILKPLSYDIIRNIIEKY